MIDRKKRMEQWISKIMLVSISIALLLIISGGLWYLSAHAYLPFDAQVFQAKSVALSTLSGVVHHFWSPLGLIQSGLMLIVAGQILRVVLTGALFYIERDGFFMLCTFVILVTMVFSFMN